MPTNIIWVATTGRAGAAGTETSPLGSIQEAVNRATPGTKIMVKSGVYTEHVMFQKSGTADAPIELISADGRGKAEIRPVEDVRDTVRVQAADHIVIDGFKIIGAELAHAAVHLSSINQMTDLPTNVIVRNNDIRAAAGDGIKVSQGDQLLITNNSVTGSTQEQGIDFVGVSNSVISHNEIFGIIGSGAIHVKGGSSNVSIEYNLIHDNARWGIQAGGSSDLEYMRSGTGKFEAVNIKVIGNEVYNSGQQALRVVGADKVAVEDNWFRGVSSTRFIDIVSATVTHEPWYSGTVTFDGNSVDRSNWLTVDSGNLQPTVLQNRTDGLAPTEWKALQAGIILNSGGTQPLPPPEPTPIPTPTPPPAPTPSPETIKTINGTSGKDALIGTSGADSINGLGGNDKISGNTGNDILTGGAGSDVFVFNTSPGTSNIDRITDFNVTYDSIYLENAVMSQLGSWGNLAASKFRIGTKALDADDRIIYDSSTGTVSYDADGSGSASSVQFATLQKGLKLTAAGFYII